MGCEDAIGGSNYYVPDGAGGVRAADLLEWGAWFETAGHDVPVRDGGRRVGDDEVPPDARVSTVFLGTNMNVFGGAPLLYETMIFGGPHDGWQRRYPTLAAAEAGHAAAVAWLRGEGAEPG